MDQSRAEHAGPAMRLDYIDALRCVAAAAVLMQHVFESSGVPALAAATEISPGVFGVALFFLVSGFVVPFSVNHAPRWTEFAVRRVTRIYPLLLTAFALQAALALAGIIHEPLVFSMSAGQWLANLFLVQDFVGAPAPLGVTWTLILEFFWYGLFALATILWGNRAARLLGIAFPLIIVALTLASLVSGHRLPLGRIGMIYAAATGLQVFQYAQGRISRGAYRFHVAAFLLIMMLGNWVAFGHFRHPHITFLQALLPWIIAPAIFFAVSGTRLRELSFWRSRPLVFLGQISFSLYLLHPIAMGLAQRVSTGWLYVALTALLSVGGAALSFRFVEKPGIRFGRWLSRKLAPRPDRPRAVLAGVAAGERGQLAEGGRRARP